MAGLLKKGALLLVDSIFFFFFVFHADKKKILSSLSCNAIHQLTIRWQCKCKITFGRENVDGCDTYVVQLFVDTQVYSVRLDNLLNDFCLSLMHMCTPYTVCYGSSENNQQYAVSKTKLDNPAITKKKKKNIFFSSVPKGFHNKLSHPIPSHCIPATEG